MNLTNVCRYSQVWFWYRCQFPRWNDWNIKYTTKGLIKLFSLRGIKLTGIITFFFALLRFYRLKRRGGSLVKKLETYRQIAGMGAVVALDKAKNAIIRGLG
jgi:hypothetical protein